MVSSAASSNPEHNQSEKNFPIRNGFEVLKLIDFTLDHASAKSVQGRFVVSKASCQPFGVLHDGVTAYIAESLGSLGAGIASGLRVAGIELTINYLQAARLGEEVVVTATPILAGNRTQVWNITFLASKEEDSSTESSPPKVFAVSRLTLIVGLPYDGSDLKKKTPQLSSSL
ncbi:hypothetical protein O6H91_03G047300 [Diphasiastrum complanatum]|uniref:Uncharacterized protein n=2 Tax=Diphasiastrum complanatum TaxID=34168 RepID=A0ACC2E4T0_DIPCM|nr:hypothetical protein O6H91_03G032200 [Diphasiastrum complanatum]KAJ7561913.1 hypothetical protein O6H91_03G047300 [Diphasiastrum complanatum]